jgi:hypothetical protein
MLNTMLFCTKPIAQHTISLVEQNRTSIMYASLIVPVACTLTPPGMRCRDNLGHAMVFRGSVLWTSKKKRWLYGICSILFGHSEVTVEMTKMMVARILSMLFHVQ